MPPLRKTLPLSMTMSRSVKSRMSRKDWLAYKIGKPSSSWERLKIGNNCKRWFSPRAVNVSSSNKSLGDFSKARAKVTLLRSLADNRSSGWLSMASNSNISIRKSSFKRRVGKVRM